MTGKPQQVLVGDSPPVRPQASEAASRPLPMRPHPADAAAIGFDQWLAARPGDPGPAPARPSAAGQEVMKAAVAANGQRRDAKADDGSTVAEENQPGAQPAPGSSTVTILPPPWVPGTIATMAPPVPLASAATETTAATDPAVAPALGEAAPPAPPQSQGQVVGAREASAANPAIDSAPLATASTGPTPPPQQVEAAASDPKAPAPVTAAPAGPTGDPAAAPVNVPTPDAPGPGSLAPGGPARGAPASVPPSSAFEAPNPSNPLMDAAAASEPPAPPPPATASRSRPAAANLRLHRPPISEPTPQGPTAPAPQPNQAEAGRALPAGGADTELRSGEPPAGTGTAEPGLAATAAQPADGSAPEGTLGVGGPDPSALAGSEKPQTAGNETVLGHLQERRAVSEQVALHVVRGLKNGLGRVHIALEPEALGRLDIRLDFHRDGRIAAMIITDNPDTLRLLRDDAGSLEQSLNAAGFKADADSLSFGLRSSNDGPGTPWQERPAPPRRAAVRGSDGKDNVAHPSPDWNVTSHDRLDIRA